MSLEQIKAAVESGQEVFWSSRFYRVVKDKLGQWFIVGMNGSTIGLTWADGVTVNGRADEFFTVE